MKVRLQGIRIKHRMKSNSIKMYDKYSVLRIETTINDPHEFKIYKEVTCKGETFEKWVPMGKSIANMYRYAQIAEASNKRYIDALAQVEDTCESVIELEELCNTVEKGDKRYIGFNPMSKQSTKIFHAILDGRNHINGFTNKDIRRILYPESSEGDLKVRNKVTRLFAKLRGHKLISKIPHSTRYKVTRKGVRLMTCGFKDKK